MSRYDYRDPGQDPAYCDGLAPDYDDSDIPNFDDPDPVVDPAEHAASDVLDALNRLEREIAITPDVDRMLVIWKMLKRVSARCLQVADKAGDRTDEIMERRR